MTDWADKLKAELSSPHSDSDSVRRLCRNRALPAELRGAVWKHVLGVDRKPDLLSAGDADAHALDLAEQDVLHAECVRVADGDEELASSMERVITYYCKARTLHFTRERGWPALVRPLVGLGLGDGTVYNCLYAILSNYVPRHCSEAGALPFAVLRLLFMYHDPAVCVHLDSLKLAPESFSAPWLRTLFAERCSTPVIRAVWDAYFVDADPFLIFFLSLVIVVNFRDAVLSATSAHDLLELLPGIPSQLNVEDIADFCAVARHYGAQTPPSFCKRVYAPLFSVRETALPIPLCVSVSAKEVWTVVHATTRIDDASAPSASPLIYEYLIVDCRSAASRASAGHAGPYAHHLDASLMMDDPEAYTAAAAAVDPSGKRHLCFMGTGSASGVDGEEEDARVHMVVARFLQRGRKYVSLLDGGYAALSRLCAHAPGVVKGTAPSGAAAAATTTATTGATRTGVAAAGSSSDEPSGAYSSLSWKAWSDYLKEKSSKVKDDFVKMVKNEPELNDIGVGLDTSKGAKLGSAGGAASQLPQKQLFQTDVRASAVPSFSIDEDDEPHASAAGTLSSATPTTTTSTSTTTTTATTMFAARDEDLSACESVDVDEWMERTSTEHIFSCNEVFSDGQMLPTYIAVGHEDLVVLRGRADRIGHAFIVKTRPLSLCTKITQKKRHANLLTFMFRDDRDSEMKHSLRFLVPEAQRCSAVVRDQILVVRAAEEEDEEADEEEGKKGVDS